MTIVKGLETTFNSVYTEYNRWRPTYVKELYDDIFAAKEINSSSNVLIISQTGYSKDSSPYGFITLTDGYDYIIE